MNDLPKIIDEENKYIVFTDGTKFYYEMFINSLALPDLIRLVDKAPSIITEIVDDLIASSITWLPWGFHVHILL